MESGDNSDTIASDSKRSFGDVGDDENDNGGSKKVCTKVEEADPSVAAALILSLQESLQECKDDLASSQNELASCQDELASCHDELASCKNKLALCQYELSLSEIEPESSQTEVNKWKSAFRKESFVPAGKSPEPGFVIDYIEKLRSSETTLKEQLEIAQMKLAIHDLKVQLKPAQMQRFTTNEDREVESKQEPTAVAGPSHKLTHLKEVEVDKNDGGTSSPPALLEELDEFQAAKTFITLLAELKESQATRRMEIEKMQAECVAIVASLVKTEKEQAESAEKIEKYGKAEKYLLEKFPSLVPPSASEGTDE